MRRNRNAQWKPKRLVYTSCDTAGRLNYELHSLAESETRRTNMFAGRRSEGRRLSDRIGCRCPRRGGDALVVEWTCERT